ncbi:ABC transporter ATP-binding protein [Mastigocladopsis repens]|uniref:ABC transporter ATP-binding protein n=1 Tax=Mastigocladopsis repens TaxID=221287 RepID=UPI0002FF4576|nr:ABC transporter ATP-binding protein [Mastigocladopsis repens]
MSDTVIRVENLGKKYIIGHQQQESYTALRDVIANRAKSLLTSLNPLTQNLKKESSNSREEFWALKDVSFEIKQGDRVGIIGRNGAGKSTLLKILSRITEPTTGSIRIKGRVASLLEVGTGFHPELTGRENIYLNGAILGMSKAEIKRKFDEIVAFAEVEKFLDTPVKRYSSGMYVRLAFAVAAHLEPEILIVDEVLAVGDAQFQKKCLGKMEEVGKEGRTVLFVSHNMGTITQLCTKAIYLRRGQVFDIGSVNSIVSKYLISDIHQNSIVQLIQYEQKVCKPIFFRDIALVNHENEISSEIDIRYPFFLNFSYEVTKALKNVELSVRIETDDGRAVFTTHQSDYNPESLSRHVGIYNVSVKFPAMFLMPGSYLVTIGAHEPMIQFYDFHEHILVFNINETGTKLAKYQTYHNIGLVIVELPWLEK